MATRDTHSSRAVRFGIDAAADIGGEKKIGWHDGKLCPRRGERRHGLTDLLRRPRTDTSHAAFLFFAFRRLARTRPRSPNVIRDLRRDGRAPRGFNREITLTYRNLSTGLKLKAESCIAPRHGHFIHYARI